MSRIDVYRAYEVLGLMPGASQEEIKQAYRKLVKLWHPDGFIDLSRKLEAEEKTKIINAAYVKLKSEPITDTDNSRDIKDKQPTSHVDTNPKPKASSAETFYNRGAENVKMGKYEDAIADFTQAIRINPFYIEAYKYRGLVCSQLGLELRATADLTKAAQLDRHFRGKYTKPPASPQTYSKQVYRTSKSKSLSAKICQTIKNWFRFKPKFRE
jgi:curved DNA-binding protein CbpA